jgi:hypothetical protein
MHNLHHLGWYGFQELALTIAREIFGQTTMSFLSSRDGGRDGSFAGKWVSTDNQELQGQFVFQCKFSNRVSYNLKLSDLKEEFPKAESLAKNGSCDIYVLITNAGVSGPLAEKIEKKLKGFGVNRVLVYGLDWITQIIRENKRLRRLVPRVYGLGDLSQILDERVYVQGRALLEELKEDLSKVVITGAYNKAAAAIDKHGFVLLIGEPAAGKTTVASLLAMGALDQWQALTMKLDTAEKVIEHWNPDDPNQFFWVDDAFGVTQYERTLVHQWNHRIIQVKAMLKKGAKIVMTSRDYIYNRARQDLKEGAFPLLNESQVVIDVHKLTLVEKRQILYNHLKMGTQPLKFREDIKIFLEYVANLQRFIPETARRIASPFFTKNLFLSEWHLKDFVNRQEGFLIEVINGLDKDNQAALALIYMKSDRLPSPIKPKPYESEAIERMGSSLGGCTSALNAMKGNLVQLHHADNELFWKFKHPTVGDAFSVFVAQSPELIEIYLQGNPIEKLLEQVTCGDMGIEKAIIVSKLFFPLILKRLKGFTSTKQYKTDYLSVWGAKRQLHEFLSSRCTREFLVQYIHENPEIIAQVSSPGLMLDTVSEVNLACAFFRENLLPENHRKTFVQTVTDYAVSGDDLYGFKSEKLRSMFKEDELKVLITRVRDELVPRIEDLRTNRQNSFISDDDADYHMQSLIENYEIIAHEFVNNEAIATSVAQQIQIAKEWVDENTIEKKIDEREKLADNSATMHEFNERSIFDDIDL